MPKSKAYANPLPSNADEQRYSAKCQELRTKIREIERENQIVQLKIVRSKKNIQRLRIERSVLYDALATITTSAAQSSGLVPSSANPPATSSLPPINTNHQQAPQSTTPTPQNLDPHTSSHETLSAPIQASTTPIDDIHSVPGRGHVTSIDATNPSSSNGVNSALNSTGVNINGHTAVPQNQYPSHSGSANHYHQNQPVELLSVEPATAPVHSVAQTIPLQSRRSPNHEASPIQPPSASTGHYQQPHQAQPTYPPSNHSAPTSATSYHAPHAAYQNAHPHPTSTTHSAAGIDSNGDRHMAMPDDPRGLEDADGAGGGEGSEEEEEEGEETVEEFDQQGPREEAEDEEDAEDDEGVNENGAQHPMSHNFQEHMAMETSESTY
ncbi:uncharacterized protein MELLADRAFT_79565 [Melampsora larici-populina 98AG31]|uniref:INO80 complex subunit F domain-containing protein n=1 Tax=Melampsora larici-populina (strain 98AG31 / pathotype 3-4-7) TaxID=747676 RepID=F4S8Q5_MELLP|nr:uncharacterized protein MELLADRAFT_79565 [Melampsora larici-populina 98AG31]EGF98935.1 hypothetical protein MELLADRAFT_79565 [Melampsora larici-populina 98AG31]